MLSKKIKKDDIEKFLIENPDFFLQKASVLNKLKFPLMEGKKVKNVVSFKDWLIENLRGQKKDLINNAKYNFLTLKKVHKAVLEIVNIKDIESFFSYLTIKLPTYFDLELINIISSNEQISKKYNLIHLEMDEVKKIYKSKNHLVLDVVDDQSTLYKKFKKKIFSNAIFSLEKRVIGEISLLVFGSKDRHFVNNRAYDLILFLSQVIEFKLGKFFDDDNN